MSKLSMTRSAPAPTLRAAIAAAVLATGLSSSPAAHAQLTFRFDYSQNAPDVGFLDPISGAANRTALEAAASGFSSLFGSHFGNSGEIVLQATSSNVAKVDGKDAPLASAGSNLLTPGSAGFGLGEVIRNKLISGTDLNGSAVDGTVDFNFHYKWQLGFGNAVLPDEFDFYGVAYHEFTHALGFASLISPGGTSPSLGSLAGDWAKYDEFLIGLDYMKIIGPSPGSPPLGAFELFQFNWQYSSVGGASGGLVEQGIYFDGPNARAANGGNPVGLYTPEIYDPGSSVSHLDTDNPALAGMMMLHAVDYGAAPRRFSAIEVGILTDLGYTPAVPEPLTAALLLAGLGVVGWRIRAQRA